MKLEPFQLDQLRELMSWFPDERSCRIWAGPQFRFPFTPGTFQEDTKLATAATWALVADDRRLVGFGQYYLRTGRCHLARLAVNPTVRGRGFATVLIQGLCEKGAAELGVVSYSLFVLPDNEPALTVYRRLGFKAVPCPDPAPQPDGIVYMVVRPGNPRRS